jgi:Na+/H+ antiporter NhaA
MGMPLSAQEVRAAAEAHSELGPEYGDAVVDSFLERACGRARLSTDQRRSLVNGIAIGGGGVGFLLSLLGEIATAPWAPTARMVWVAILLASICSCLAGLTRMFRDRR